MKIPWRRRNAELDDELQHHLQAAVRERIERGESPADAERNARREFGSLALVKETTRESWGGVWLGDLAQDFRYALRLLRKNAGFTAVAVLTLALGIGANTAIFSVVNGVLLNPLPFPSPDQLVGVHESKPNFDRGSISFPNFRDWRDLNRSFSSMAVARAYAFSLTGLGEPERVRAEFVSSDFFRMLAVQPLLGRTFLRGEDEIGAPPIALISEGFWRRKLGADPNVLGRSLTLDGLDHVIVGVIPSSFDLRIGNFRTCDIYVPIGVWTNSALRLRSAGLGLHGIARLKPGVTLAQARADMESVTRSLAAAYPDVNTDIGAALAPLKEEMLGSIRPFLLLLLAAVGFVLLIACVNVANLLLARATARTREFAIRAALGAERARLARQLLTESVLLGLAGGALGALFASWGTQAALGVLPTALPRASEIRLDARVLIFTAAVSLFAGLLFGIVPALKMARAKVHETLKEGGRGTSSAPHRAQGVLVVAEVVMALVLLIGAGLMTRTLARLWAVDPGFQPDNVLTFGLDLPPAMNSAAPDAIRAALRNVTATLAATQGVHAASFYWGSFPLYGDDEELFWLDGQSKPARLSEMNWALKYVVEPGYIVALRLSLERGRFFTSQDDEHAPPVAVVDSVFARKYFGKEDPLGKRLHLNSYDHPAVIVGVVGHVKQWGLDRDDTQALRAQLYLSFAQLPDSLVRTLSTGTGIVVRADGAAPFSILRSRLRELNSQNVIYGAQTMNEIISATLAARRFSMILLGTFASLALLLACVGIYGVCSYLVGLRTQEIGIRVALGAQRWDVLRLVLGQGMKLVFAGIVIGLAAALGLTRLMTKMLYGVSATDPLTFAGVALVLSVVAFLACFLPARRALRVDPVVALRYE